jgi:hypothetical protein
MILYYGMKIRYIRNVSDRPAYLMDEVMENIIILAQLKKFLIRKLG